MRDASLRASPLSPAWARRAAREGAVVGVAAAALLSPETRTRLCGCVLLASLAVWEDYAAAVAKQIINAAAATAAGIGVKASGGVHSGLAVLCAADDEGGGSGGGGGGGGQRAAPRLGDRGGVGRPSLPYLVRIDAAERSRRLGVARFARRCG